MFSALAIAALTGCSGTAEDSAADSLWADYSIQAPSAEITTQLTATPFLWHEEVCVDASDYDLPEDTSLSDSGELCVQDNFSGNVPEGLHFTDVLTCDRSFTQGPSWFVPPSQVYESDPALLDDADFVEELKWVRDQVSTSGCACCHDSSAASGHTSGFDVAAPGIWTDRMTNAQLSMGAGWFEEHLLFGHYDPSVNHGFDRTETLFASTDPERMKAFFESELERRAYTEEDIEDAQGQFDALFGRMFTEVFDCIDPYEGVVDGTLLWNGGAARQIYILEEGAQTPGFPPNLHLPEGTCLLYTSDAADE